MLCDDVIHAANPRMWRRPFGLRRPQGALRNWLMIAANRVRSAQRFAISAEALHVISHVAQSKPSSLMAGLGIARLPFHKLFIEYDWNQRFRILVDEFDYPDLREDKAKKLRFGLLASATDETLQRGTVHLLTKYDDYTPTMGPIYLDFDFALENNLVRQRHAERGTLATVESVKNNTNNRHPKEYSPRFVNQPSETDAMTEMNNIFDVCYDPEAKPHLEQIGEDGQDAINKYVNSWRVNMGGEARFFLGTIMLLNSRNLADVKEVSVRDANRVRRSNDLQSIVTHHRVSIKLTKVSRNRMNSQGIPVGEMAYHMVRGHWKVRKTGVFFWRPHFAGNRDKGTVVKDYDVRP